MPPHGDPLFEREQRNLADARGDADDQVIDELHRALDDVEVAKGYRIEGSRIEPYATLTHRIGLLRLRHYSLPSPDTSSIRSTETTRSVPSTRKSVTPCVARPAIRMLATGTRMVCPWSVINIRWSDSSTGNDATTPLFLRAMAMATMPEPPRPV